ncbi:MAG: ribose 5-phosphate isomerase B [Clostridiales bacterium]|jgi:ribose 5-phosphate isomerase B|nr:ribose 5-phosphate isomerase B [Clostridiales bacterium]
MIALGSDHGGYALKLEILKHLDERGAPCKDYGSFDENPADYPVYAKLVSDAILSGECEKGILICGTGVGISIAANRRPGIRAALCADVYTARLARMHNDANILAMGGRVVGTGLAREIADAFLETGFSADERHARRISLIEELPESPDNSKS